MEQRLQKILGETLITGASGMVGSYVDFGIKMDHQALDVTDFKKCQLTVARCRPKVIIHLAALTDLKRCDLEPDLAFSINGVGAYNMAMAARAVKAKFIYVSTDAVFPNSQNPHGENDQPNPESFYGHSKYLGELVVRGILGDCIIARTAWVFGGGSRRDKKFVAKIIGQLDKPEIEVVNDQFNSPTFAGDLVEAIKGLISQDQRGIFHLVNSGMCSRYDIAVEIVNFFGRRAKVVPVDSAFFNLPPYLQSSGGLISKAPLRPWQDALRAYLEKEWAELNV